MVIDTSALFAIVTKEPERERFLILMKEAATVEISAVTLYETRVVLFGRFRDPQVLIQLDEILDAANCKVVPFDSNQANRATHAYRQYGKGYHPAGLNLLDCVAYGLATARHQPLLFKGDDFSRTDVQSV
jgi:ribonuclease VapC